MLLPAADALAPDAQALLQDVRRIVFLGDSITQKGDYVADVECWLLSRGVDVEVLNLGPTAEGIIPEPSVERLKAMGAWMKVNGEAIYGTGPTPFGAEAGSFDPVKKDKDGKPLFNPAWVWRCTTKPGKLFIHIFDWPENGKFELPSVKEKITKAYLLADPQRADLKMTQSDSGVSIALPEKAPDPIASVVCLELETK